MTLSGLLKKLLKKTELLLGIWFTSGWLIIANLASTRFHLISLIVPAMTLLFWQNSRGPLRPLPSLILFGLTIIGLSFEFAMLKLKLVTFANGVFLEFPVWLICLWLHYVLSLPVLITPFRKRVLIGALVAALFGPLSYLSGQSLGALQLSQGSTIFVYSLFWACHFALSLRVAIV